MEWEILDSIDRLEQIKLLSFSEKIRAVSLFKHSTRCFTSTYVKKLLESEWEFDNNQLPIYYLDLIEYRDISNLIAEQFKVEHQSPQLILIKNGKSIFDASHENITIDAVRNALL